jgi:hypothetical protein
MCGNLTTFMPMSFDESSVDPRRSGPGHQANHWIILNFRSGLASQTAQGVGSALCNSSASTRGRRYLKCRQVTRLGVALTIVWLATAAVLAASICMLASR